MGDRPIQRRRQARTAIELFRVPPALLPGARRSAQPELHTATLGVLLQPAPQAWPLTQERLVRDLDLTLADGDQSLLRQHGQYLGHAMVAPAIELNQPDAPADDRLAFSQAGQPQQDPPGESPAIRREPFIGPLGQPCHRALHAADVLVGTHLQALAIATLPQLQERCGQQR